MDALKLIILMCFLYEFADSRGSTRKTSGNAQRALSTRPHIIFIIIDDLGFNDVGFHGSNQIPTPNIDALAYKGVILNRYYVTAICTPSRSAVMTGKYPIHTGMQHTVLYAAEPRGLPLTEKLLPQYLQELGYENHIVGKWHLGHFRREYTPTHRGFKSHLGFWTGHQDYYDHTAVEDQYWGLDMRRNMEPAWDLHGQYSTDIFTKEAVKIIKQHNSSVPLFLYLAHTAVHSANPYDLLQAPDSVVAKFNNIKDYSRQKYAAMVSKVDDSVGKVVNALANNGMLDNSIIVFTTDNGGPAAGFNGNAASNWPLRGVKNTLWEGGVRGASFVWSPLINNPSRVSSHYMHISDWLPTLYSVAGGDVQNLGNIDGKNMWNSISQDKLSNRTEILHNIDDIYGNAALTIGKWKIVKGTTYNGQWDGWYGPSGRDEEPFTYDIGQVLGSKAGRALYKYKTLPAEKILSIREQATIFCNSTDNAIEATPCKPLIAPCIFNIIADPCEKNNLAARYPHILNQMIEKLNVYNRTAVRPSNLPKDPRADPRFWDHVWTNFGDHSFRYNTLS